MSPLNWLRVKGKLKLTVVRKMVIGFASLAVLLVVTSGLSYIGLSDIKVTAEKVAFEKMPIQAAVSSINENVLNLARVTTNAYFESDKQKLDELKKKFDRYYETFQSNVDALSKSVSAQNTHSLNEALVTSERYLKASQQMFDKKKNNLLISEAVKSEVEKALKHTDEASALMLDLSYLEGDSADLNALIGMSTNIDNKLGIMLGNIKELGRAADAEKVENIIGDIDYSLSNVEVDADYARRVAQTLDDQGILNSFDAEFAIAKTAIAGESGLFSLKREELSLQASAYSLRKQASQAIDQALSALKELSVSVNKDALNGQESILSAVHSNVIKSIVISIIGIFATVTLAYIATSSIAKPLKEVNKRLRILSKGDLSQSMDDSGNDEFSELAANINQLIDALRGLIGSINEKEKTLRKVTLKSIEMGDQSLKKVAQQQSQIDATSQNTHQVKVTSKSNIEQIEQADTKIEEAISQSVKVVTLVKQSVVQVNEQARQAKESAVIVNRLGSNSSKIGGILDVIKTIADQTNLLALNAAIEAARAGEQGRGFAVVADEVRTLATRTHNSTEEIEKMIASLQSDSTQAVVAMNDGHKQVQKGVELNQEVCDQIEHIKTIIESLAIVNHKIVDGTQTQDQLLEDVDDRLSKIVALSKESALSTEASNDASHEIKHEMNALREAVGKFKLH